MSDNPGKLSRIWKELRRRNVLRSLAVYAGSAFVILEAATIIFPRWNLPDWSIDLLLYLLILGAFITGIVAWIFDITPQGVQKTKPLEEEEAPRKPEDSKVWKAATYVSLVIIVGLVIFNLVTTGSTIKAGDIQSLVVLPFDNFTGDDELEYFVSGMHASLIGDMGRVGGLRITSKTTSNKYKDAKLSIPEIAEELSVDAVVETQIMCLGDTICMQVRVITPYPEEKELWSSDYRQEKSQILNLYNRVTRQIAQEVKVELSPNEARVLNETRIVNKEAYDDYLMGLFYWDKLSPESLQKALDYFNSAIEKDPQWAPPYSGIAQVWLGMAQMGFAAPETAGPIIHENLTKALELDPEYAESHYAQGLIGTWVEWNWEKGEREFQRALELNPNDAMSRIYYAHLLIDLRRNDEAIRQGEMALELDPLNPLVHGLYAVVMGAAGRWGEAMDHVEKAISLDPTSFFAHHVMEMVSYENGDGNALMKALRFVFPLEEVQFTSIEKTLSEKGLMEAYIEFISYLEILEQSQFLVPIHMANRYIRTNQPEKALESIQKGVEVHDQNVPYIVSGFMKYDPLYGDPRFRAIVEQLKLPMPQ
jgi:TolB-like protein/Tfp pilus assembly protein PilF